jgi:hypothetical protein
MLCVTIWSRAVLVKVTALANEIDLDKVSNMAAWQHGSMAAWNHGIMAA